MPNVMLRVLRTTSGMTIMTREKMARSSRAMTSE